MNLRLGCDAALAGRCRSRFPPGKSRVTLLSQFEAPLEPGLPWRLIVTGGSIVLGGPKADEAPLVLNRILMRAALDSRKASASICCRARSPAAGSTSRCPATWISRPASRALSGGMVGTPMKGHLAKRIWPIFVASKVRTWVLENVQGGDVSRVELAANAPLPTLREDGPPDPRGRAVGGESMSATRLLRPVDGLPAIRDAELTTRIKGRNVVVNVGRGRGRARNPDASSR